MSTDIRNQSWTVLELLNWTTDHFRKAGVHNPRLNAEMLLSKALALERIMLYARFDEEVGAEQRATFRSLVSRRAAREPLQYVLGEWEFHGRPFEVSRAVMVPRQETELVVERCLNLLPPDGRELRAGDVCTGSGAIAVTLAAERDGLRVVATDASAGALEVAVRNAERHGVADRVVFAQGDLAGPLSQHLPEGRPGVDLLVSNPPYVPTGQIERLQAEVRDYEPREALDGGPDGLDVIRRLVLQAGRFTAPGGWLVLELGEDQAQAAAQLIGQTGAFDMDTVETKKDSDGCERVLSARRSAQ